MVELSKAVFNELEGDTFIVDFEGGPTVELVLTEIKSRENLDTEETENFSLLFSGPEELPMEQGTFILQHTKLGSPGIFLVPVKQEQGRIFYEAAYCRKKTAATSAD